MERKVAWIGSTMYHKAQIISMQDEFGVTVEEHRFADDGLSILLKERYPLIIVRDQIVEGRLILPTDIEPDDYCGISCYFIKEVRKNSVNKETPLVVPRSNSSLTPIEKYMAAGATKCFTTFSGQPLEFFNDQVREYLK